jgi:hypothetical protein
MKRLRFKPRRIFASKLSALALFILMAVIGTTTVYASLSTIEVIAEHDMPYTTALKSVTLDKQGTDQLLKVSKTEFNPGSFGVPYKIRFPEAKRHITIKHAIYEDNNWKASSTYGHTFLSGSPRQKMFGESIVYLRINTDTTQNLGEILIGDTFNVVTTENWQLGYKVIKTADSYADLATQQSADVSNIVLVLIDDITGATSYYRAALTKVGERI